MDPANRAALSSAWRWFALAAAVVLADQVTKAMVLSRFVLGERLEVTGFFNMVLVYNKGAAFSFLSDAAGWQTPLLIGFALVAIGIVGTLLVRSPGRRLLCSGLALILGGALGNLIDQRRKDAEASPYINHPIALADVLVNEGGVTDIEVLCAALLHDTVEDTATTHEELVNAFGSRIARIVAEGTDDQRLPKAERKRLQVEHAPTISKEAKLVKLAD